jgi:hypothetical protein
MFPSLKVRMVQRMILFKPFYIIFGMNAFAIQLSVKIFVF